jgi:hypothetical protein
MEPQNVEAFLQTLPASFLDSKIEISLTGSTAPVREYVFVYSITVNHTRIYILDQSSMIFNIMGKIHLDEMNLTEQLSAKYGDILTYQFESTDATVMFDEWKKTAYGKVSEMMIIQVYTAHCCLASMCCV